MSSSGPATPLDRLQRSGRVAAALASLRPMQASRSAALDALRAIAALLVIGQHTLIVAPEPDRPDIWLHFVRSHLWVGVDIFFALSGFLIAGPFIRALLDGRSLPDTAGYVVRRIARIGPAYWVALTVAVLLVVVPTGWLSVASHYAFLHSWVPEESRALYTVSWTLAVEVSFYLLVPVGAYLLRRRFPGPVPRARMITILLWVWVASIAWGLAWGAFFDVAGALLGEEPLWRSVVADNLPTQLGLFVPGMLLAVVFAGERRADLGEPEQAPRLRGVLGARSSVLVAASLVIAVVGIVVGGSTRTGQSLRESLFLPAACGLVLLLFLRGGPVVRAVTPWLAPLGIVSYGIYLWHWIVAEFLAAQGWYVTPGGQWVAWLLAFVIILTLTLPFAVASWLLVERPVMLRAAAYALARRQEAAPSRAAARAGAPGDGTPRGDAVETGGPPAERGDARRSTSSDV